MQSFKLRNIPEAHDYKGRVYPAHVDLVLVCSRGLRWDGGEYPTRAEAVVAGERQMGRPA